MDSDAHMLLGIWLASIATIRLSEKSQVQSLSRYAPDQTKVEKRLRLRSEIESTVREAVKSTLTVEGRCTLITSRLTISSVVVESRRGGTRAGAYHVHIWLVFAGDLPGRSYSVLGAY